MRIAVIGANGFLGSALVNQMLIEGIDVLAVYNRKKENINKKAVAITSLKYLSVVYPADVIIFAAGSYQSDIHAHLSLNNMLYNICKVYPSSRLIYISSTNVYGCHATAIKENSPFINPSIYGHSKLAGEFIAKSMTSFSIIRFTYLYGSKLDNNSILPNLIQKAKKEGTITIFGEGERQQDYLHISDAVQMCMRVAHMSSSELFLGASGISHSNRIIAEKIQSVVGCDLNFLGQEESCSFYFEPNESFNKLSWQPQKDFTEGLKEMIECVS